MYLRLVCFRRSGESCPLPARRRALRFHDPEPALVGFLPWKRAFSAPPPSVEKPDLWRTRHLPTPPGLSTKPNAWDDQASVPCASRERHKESSKPGRLCQQMLFWSQLTTTTLPSWPKHSRPLHHPAEEVTRPPSALPLRITPLGPGAICSRLQPNTTHKRTHRRSTSICREGTPSRTLPA